MNTHFTQTQASPCLWQSAGRWAPTSSCLPVAAVAAASAHPLRAGRPTSSQAGRSKREQRLGSWSAAFAVGRASDPALPCGTCEARMHTHWIGGEEEEGSRWFWCSRVRERGQGPGTTRSEEAKHTHVYCCIQYPAPLPLHLLLLLLWHQSTPVTGAQGKVERPTSCSCSPRPEGMSTPVHLDLLSSWNSSGMLNSWLQCAQSINVLGRLLESSQCLGVLNVMQSQSQCIFHVCANGYLN